MHVYVQQIKIKCNISTVLYVAYDTEQNNI